MNMYNYIENYIQSKTSPILFELGGHWGEDTERLMNFSRNKKSKIVSVEPDQRNIKVIKSKKELNNYPNCDFKLIEGAISNKVGKTKLYLSDGVHKASGNIMTGANSIRKPKEVLQIHKWIGFTKTVEVKTFTIDYLCKENNVERIDFIWSDIQGCEYDMIKGAKKTINNIGLMLLEYSDVELYEGQKTLDEIFNLLGNNWELVFKTNCDVLVRNKKYNNE